MIVALNKWYGCMMGKLTYEWIWWLGAANGQLLPSEDFQRFQNGVSWAQTCISINLVVLTWILSNWCRNFHCPISQPKYHSNQPRSKYGKEKLSGNCVDNLSSNWYLVSVGFNPAKNTAVSSDFYKIYKQIFSMHWQLWAAFLMLAWQGVPNQIQAARTNNLNVRQHWKTQAQKNSG